MCMAGVGANTITTLELTTLELENYNTLSDLNQ